MPVHMEWCETCGEITRFVRVRTQNTFVPLDRYECIRCCNRRDRDEPRQYVFIGYNPQELAATPGYEPVFRPGDLLAEDLKAKHHLADDIVVVRLEDDVVDSVWPEEVRRLT